MNRRMWCLLYLALVIQAGCAVHLVGIVDPNDPGPAVVSTDGRRHHLSLDAGSRPLGALDGHLVEVDGVRFAGRVRVSSWRVLEGRHGMPTWVGTVVVYGIQLGIQDHNSGALYFLDDAGAAAIQRHLGEIVLVEGYIDGPHRVKVLYWRALAGSAPGG